MFSFVFSLAINAITITTDETSKNGLTSTLLEGSSSFILDGVRQEQRHSESESLLSILDDKNRLIASLNKQVENQKMQLSYYINKELSKSKIRQFSKSCTPEASEESLPLNLAINRFCKQAGIKTKLLLLHEHMKRLDYKISHLLKNQEFILKKIVNKLCDFLKGQERATAGLKDSIGSFISDPIHVRIFNKLVTATLDLKRKLDCFKICCDRVLIIEEERNALVEQAYSLPVEERINCNYMIKIQMEKAQLENEIKRISQRQGTGRHRIKELNVIEKILHNLQWELNGSFLQNEENCISKMLKKINSEARVLLEMTKEQKRKFEGELSKTKCPEPNRVLLFINMASGGDKFQKKDFDRHGIKTDEEIRFFEMIKQEVSMIRKKVKDETEQEFKKLLNDYDILRGKMAQILLDNDRTIAANKSLQEEVEELRLERKNGIQRLRQERDAYKTQVEDLQAIREAYAQLVDKQPSTLQMEREFLQQIDQRDNRILELERLVASQRGEIDVLKRKVAEQNDQNILLNRFINLTSSNSSRSDRANGKGNVHAVSAGSKNILNTDSKNQFLDGHDKANKVPSDEKKSQKLDNVFSRYSRSSKGIKKSDKRSNQTGTASQCHQTKGPMHESPFAKEIQKLIAQSFETLSQSGQESSSCINIFSVKSRKSRDIVQTVVTTSEEIKGTVEMEKSSVFSMEIKYLNKSSDNTLFEVEECEIFKNISRESVVLANKHETMLRH